MMSRPSHNEAKETPGGEYTVAYERPFPKRLDQAFGWAAIATGTLVAGAGIVGAAFALHRGDTNGAVVWACGGLAFAPILAMPVYGLGMAICGLYRLTLPKAHIVEWREVDTYGRQLRATLIFFGILFAEAALFGILKHFG